MENGNARDYVQDHPDCDRLQIVTSLLDTSLVFSDWYIQFHHVSLGLVYLHSMKIIHGDIKAVSIIICLPYDIFIHGHRVAQHTNR